MEEVIQKILLEFAEKVKKQYQMALDENNVNYTGKLRNTIEIEIDVNGDVYSVYLKLTDEYGIVETGRKAAFAPIAPLQMWVAKKIPQSQRLVNPKTNKIPTDKNLAFAISKSMSRKGIEGKHLLKQTLDEVDVKDVVNKINEAIGREINEYAIGIMEEELNK